MKHVTTIIAFLIFIVSIIVSGSSNPTAFAQTEDEFVYLPIVANPVPPPILNSINNGDWDNYYTVSWAPLGVDYYVLEESPDPAFSNPVVVYQGTVSAWSVPAPGKYPGNYYYRVKAFSGTEESTWSNVESIAINPLYVGLDIRWDGAGFLNIGQYYEPGVHITRSADAIVSPDVLRVRGRQWHDPDPLAFGESLWNSFYSVSTGDFLSSSVPSDPAWRWGYPWIIQYDFEFHNGQTVLLDGQPFLVTGPHSGFTTFGQPVQFWELTNEERFLFYDNGGEWTQYVHAGDAKLRYDAGATRLLIYSNILRRLYQNGDLTDFTLHYIINLTAVDSFPGGSVSESDVDASLPEIDKDQKTSPVLPDSGLVPSSALSPSGRPFDSFGPAD